MEISKKSKLSLKVFQQKNSKTTVRTTQESLRLSRTTSIMLHILISDERARAQFVYLVMNDSFSSSSGLFYV